MAKSTACANDLLKLLFNATNWANIATSTGAANITVALHTASPGAGGTQSTSEASYTGYARVNVVRTTSGWTASTAGSTSPVANIEFAQGQSGANQTITHWSVGTGTSNYAIQYGAVTPNIVVTEGVIPRLTTA